MVEVVGMSVSTFVNLKSCTTFGLGATATTRMPFVPAADEVAHDGSQGGRVHLRHCGEIEEVDRWGLVAGGRFEVEDIAEGDLLHGAVHVAGVE